MLPSLVMLTLLLAPARIAPPPAPAGYPTPRAAGFHHCALIYDRPQRGAADLAPYVARTDAGRARESLFDAFLFLIQESGRGVRTEYGLTERVDWEYQLDRWFAPGRDLAALDDAIDRAAKDLGQPAARQVILSIPYPNPGVRAFADVDGDGKPEDLATPQGRRAVFSWYTAEARRRFNAAHYRHLALWGFYWMREDMDGGDQDRIAEAAAVVHAGGGRLLWIPWWCAPGWDKWREAGIDVAVMQPNYAFWSSGHNGRVRRNRLAVDADLTRAAGMGVEMEAGEAIASEEDRRAFLHYLADGAPGRLGYQAGAQAWYLGTDLVERSSSSADPRARAVYAALADYVAGRAVPDPDPSLVLKWHHSRGERIGEGRLARPSWIGDVEVSLDEPGKAWRGTVQVELQSPGSRSWSGGGWAIRASADAGDGRHQMLVVPVGQRAQALRVTLRSQDPRTTPPTGAVGVNPAGEHAVRRHLALGCSYRVSPG